MADEDAAAPTNRGGEVDDLRAVPTEADRPSPLGLSRRVLVGGGSAAAAGAALGSAARAAWARPVLGPTAPVQAPPEVGSNRGVDVPRPERAYRIRPRATDRKRAPRLPGAGGGRRGALPDPDRPLLAGAAPRRAGGGQPLRRRGPPARGRYRPRASLRGHPDARGEVKLRNQIGGLDIDLIGPNALQPTIRRGLAPSTASVSGGRRWPKPRRAGACSGLGSARSATAPTSTSSGRRARRAQATTRSGSARSTRPTARSTTTSRPGPTPPATGAWSSGAGRSRCSSRSRH